MTRMNSATSIAPNSSPRVVVADRAVGALDAVQAVDRRGQRVDDDPRRVLPDRVVRARDRRAVRVVVVPAGRDDPRQRATTTIRMNRIV